MIVSYKFSNFCGCVHKNGNILFSQKLNQLFSPVGNKINVFDLEHNVSTTLPCEARNDIHRIALSPDSRVLICIDKDGYAVIINLLSRVISNHFNFKEKVNDIKYSPDGKFVAICSGRSIKIFEAPDISKSIEPMLLFKKYNGAHNDDIKLINWSLDSRLLLSCSKDNTVRIFTLFHIKDYAPICLTGHKASIVYAFADEEFAHLYTLAKDGMFLFWKWVDDYVSESYKSMQEYQKFKSGKRVKISQNEGIDVEGAEEEEEDMKLASDLEKKIRKGRFILEKKQMFQQSGSKISTAAYHYASKLFIVGFRNGIFGLYRLEGSNMESLQTFSVAEAKITSIAFNQTGSWIGLSCASLGQLMVWEWRSQTYVLNQQGLFYEVVSLDYSQNGNVLATGGADGKVKLWDTKSYLCFATFKEHASKVTGVKFVPQNANTLVSSSLDGTVRAYDTKRYRNFRTMRPDENVQLECLAVDPVGDIVCAGSVDPYFVYCWSIQTGHLIDKITGHEGPISSLHFSPLGNLLASGSWDKTIRISDIYAKERKVDILEHTSEITEVVFRPDGKEICSSTLKGELYLWSVEDGQPRGVIDCKRDIMGGRSEGELRSAKNSTSNKHFTSIMYSADGEYVLAGGNSKYVCLYYLRQRVLLKRFILTQNRALGSLFDKLSARNIKEGVNMNDIDNESDSDIEERKDMIIPGSKKPDSMKRNTKLKIECRKLSFAPSGESWAVATTEGVSIYSFNDTSIFAPLELDEEVSIEGIKSAFIEGRYFAALMAALKLNEKKVLQSVYQNIPASEVNTISQSIPSGYLERFLTFIAIMVRELPNIELNLKWIEAILFYHSGFLKNLSMTTLSTFRNILKSLHQRSNYLISLCQDNIYTLNFLQDHIDNHALGVNNLEDVAEVQSQ